MDPQFTELLTRVMLLGGAMGLIGAGAVLLAFRAFAPARRRSTVLIIAVLAFVFVCCALLLRVSFR